MRAVGIGLVMNWPAVIKSVLHAYTDLVYASSIILARFTKALIFIDVAILSAPPRVTAAPVATRLGQQRGLGTVGRDLDRLGIDKTKFFTTGRKFCVMNGLVLK